MGSVDLTAERTAIACVIQRKSPDALVVSLANGRWVSLPLHQVRHEPNGSVSMPSWLAREKGLI